MPPIPTKILVSKSASGISKVKSASIFRFILKNWYFVIVLLVLLPNLISSVNTAKDMNFSVPVYLGLKTGQTILNADSSLYEEVKLLEKSPSDAIGMEKPTEGIYNHVKYDWKIFVFCWILLGYLFLIFLPFNIIYKLVRPREKDQFYRNLWTAIWVGFIFVFLMNLIVIVIQQSSGNVLYQVDSSLNFFQKAWTLIVLMLPFHGLYALGSYIFLALF